MTPAFDASSRRATSILRLIGLVALAAFVGMLFEVVKGDGTNAFRYEIGNLAAPWLIVPFLGGRSVRRPVGGAVIGAFLALVSLLAFYALLEALTHSLSGTVRSNYELFLTAGVIAGALFGALGSASLRSRLWWAIFAIPAAFMGEALIAAILGVSGGRSLPNIVVWGLEFAVGIVAAIWSARARRELVARVSPEISAAPRADSHR